MIDAIIIKKCGRIEKITIPSDYTELDRYLTNLFQCYTIAQYYDEETNICYFFDDSFYLEHGTKEKYEEEENKIAEKMTNELCVMYGDVVATKFNATVKDNIYNIVLKSIDINDLTTMTSNLFIMENE